VFGVFAIKVVFSSNTLTGTIIVPLVLALGTSLGLDARGLALAAALASNLAFILVTTSPVNVIPYTTGFFTIRDMAKAGVALAAIAALVTACILTLIGGAAGIV
jgi:sodium-dependent dicarboxylate transporter 2/3/5